MPLNDEQSAKSRYIRAVIPGRDEKDTAGVRSMTVTVLSDPHAHPHNHVRSERTVAAKSSFWSTPRGCASA